MTIPSIDEVRTATRERYEIDGLYAQGGMGAVFVGRHRELRSKVAVKVLPRDVTQAPERLARFKREAALAANLSHPHIVPVFEFQVTADMAYLVMPFVEGKTLAEYVSESGPFDYNALRTVLREVGSALRFAHAKGVVHRDVKPSNILREEESGRWMLTDFGVARGPHSAGGTLTYDGAVVGTPAYMAPEQAAGSPDIDARADLYGLAAAAFEALTGLLPDIMRDADAAERALAKERPELPPALIRALTSPLALDRTRRPASAQEWLDSLESAERPRATAAVRRVPMWVAALPFVLGVAAGWLSGRGSPAPAEVATVVILPFAVPTEMAGLNLPTALPRAFEAQLQWVPDYRVVNADRVGEAIATRFPNGADLDSLVRFVMARYQATEVVWGSAVLNPSGDLTLNVQVRSGTPQRVIDSQQIAGAPDSLGALVSALVSNLFAQRVAAERAGWSEAIPRGLDAFHAYYQAESSFRRAAYADAIMHLDEVISHDSAFAPAYFKRMLAEILRTQPTRATAAVHSALHAARAYRERLDPTSAAVLEAYDILLTDGDLDEAHERFQEIAQSHPLAVNAWFLLGYLQFNFAALIDIPRTRSREAFERAYGIDPRFAAAIAQLAQIAILDRREDAARRYIREYLRIDSVSVWAELARMGDSLLYGGPNPAFAVRGSFEQRPAAALEIIGLAAGELTNPPQARVIAQDAVDALWQKAATRRDRQVAFRMLLATQLGGGRQASAESLLAEARLRDVPAGELDRWRLLGAVTGVAQLSGDSDLSGLARQLAAQDDAEALWLAARWFRGREAGVHAAVRRRLNNQRDVTPHAQSLAIDLEALDDLASGDTAAALQRWTTALDRYSIEEVPFGLTGSLWPLRLEMARVARSAGEYEVVRRVTTGFMQMAGFIDQVAWAEVLPLRVAALRAANATSQAEATRAALSEVLRFANGRGAMVRDSVRGSNQ